MASILLSGPAGVSKSQAAAELIQSASAPLVVADFQSLIVAMRQLRRGPDGRYPARPTWILPLTEYVRAAVVTGAVRRDISVIITNSDGNPERRKFLLERLGPGATETIIDPGIDVVQSRLADSHGELEPECSRTIPRWYSRK